MYNYTSPFSSSFLSFSTSASNASKAVSISSNSLLIDFKAALQFVELPLENGDVLRLYEQSHSVCHLLNVDIGSLWQAIDVLAS